MLVDPKEILKKYWGFSEFKGSQERIINAVLENKDVLSLLPTGGGKSLCFQIPALAKDGICIVVSPLIALIQNQVENLKVNGIKAIALTGGIPFDEVNSLLDNCLYGNYKFLYLSPERLQQDIVKERIRQMNVNLIAIDEAHCISQWGNDFRPAYLQCAVLRELSPEAPIIALTATATKKVAEDIKENLQFIEPITVKDSFARDNITFKVLWEEDKLYRLRLLCANAQKSVIVYTRNRRATEELSRFLQKNKNTATFYHGGIPKAEKEKRLNQWLTNEVKVMVATNAFGMGVDKPDVDLVVHYQIPDSIENYFQEAGRAGRDGTSANAVLITHKADEQQLRNQFLQSLPTVDFLKKLYRTLNNYFQISYGEGNDETFQLHFHQFCEIYKFNGLMAYNGLRCLDQNSVISLSDSFSKKTTVQFIASKEALFSYIETHSSMATAVQTLLRTYGGIFEFETRINPVLIAKKSSIPETEVLRTLEQLHKDEIIKYNGQHNDLEITFLVPREDDRTIHVFAKKVKEQIAIRTNNVESMLSYIQNNNKCRAQQLLHYFGENKKQKCGACDVCNAPKSIDPHMIPLITEELLVQLKKKAQSSRELIQVLTYKEEAILATLQHLLEEETIQINTRNKYEIS